MDNHWIYIDADKARPPQLNIQQNRSRNGCVCACSRDSTPSDDSDGGSTTAVDASSDFDELSDNDSEDMSLPDEFGDSMNSNNFSLDTTTRHIEYQRRSYRVLSIDLADSMEVWACGSPITDSPASSLMIEEHSPVEDIVFPQLLWPEDPISDMRTQLVPESQTLVYRPLALTDEMRPASSPAMLACKYD